MREYLEDVDKGQPICIKALNPLCACYLCKTEREEKKEGEETEKLITATNG